MQVNSEINQIIEKFEHFELDEKEYLVDIFTKELREEKRDRIYKRYLEAKENRVKGKVKVGNVQDLKADLEED
jgi:5-methylcytosine-specific restriction endonuclease McrBC regulatory subunit McrC